VADCLLHYLNEVRLFAPPPPGGVDIRGMIATFKTSKAELDMNEEEEEGQDDNDDEEEDRGCRGWAGMGPR